MDHPTLTRRRATFLPFSPPCLGEEEIAAVAAALRSGWITTGPRVETFERRFGALVDADAAVALNSCTAALHLALVVAGVGPGNAVVTTPLTFAGTVNVIRHVGATPVLADVAPDTLSLDPESARRAVAEATAGGLRVRALLPVHYAGHPCDMAALDALAEEHDLAVVEDAAHALPAERDGRRVGAMRGRSLAAFSFYANKNLTTGEGGMLTGPADLLERARVLRNSGIGREPWQRGGTRASWRYEVHEPGWKFNMTDVAAAMGLAQLDKLPAFQARRHAIAARYSAAFAQHAAVEVPTVLPGVTHAWHLYPLRLRLERLTIDRDRFVNELHARRIGASVHFIPIHLHAGLRDLVHVSAGGVPQAERAFARVLSLPIHPQLGDEDVDDVIAAVCDIAERHGNGRGPR